MSLPGGDREGKTAAPLAATRDLEGDVTATTATGQEKGPSPTTADASPPPLETADPPQAEQALEKSATQNGSDNGFPMPQAKRVRTAPAERVHRRHTGHRTKTTLPARQHNAGTTRMYSSRHGGFEYRFDAITSDSEDSSSSSEDETPLDESTPTQAAQATQDEPVAAGSEERRRFMIGNDYFRTKGRVSKKDGRLKISINETVNSGYIAKALGASIRNHLDIPRRDKPRPYGKHKEKQQEKANEIAASSSTRIPRPKLNIVIMVIGSRGDIQPFIKIGKVLKETYGHRIRLATHPVFQEFVERTGLEFFDVGGDPSELMAFMVKNPGLIPNMQTLREGEISKRRTAMGIMFEGFWQSCIADSKPLKTGSRPSPFIADAIIANPPSMAHVHIAERLGIPLHIMFTFPYTPTTQFPHPLANIKMRKSNVDAGYVNFMSYPLVEMMTWQGLGDIVNRFRENTLRLEPVSSLWAPGALYRMKVPYTYLWSPSLVPKPQDWGPEIDIAGFVFLNLAQYFEPPEELAEFMKAGPPPVYIGFGSIVVDDPNKFTEMILKAVELAGVRALISKGWGGLGANNESTPKNVYMLGNIPHDWLFPQVSAVVHHGGAGTTAIGLKCARPTMIVPFFGDQPFWGNMVAEARAGAFECIPYKKLTAERLAEGIKQCLTEEAKRNVQKIADSISKEGGGAENAITSFLRSLPMSGRHSMRCSILQERVAVWKVKKSSLRLSALAAELLHEQGKVKWSELKLIRHYAWNDFDGPGEPFTGGVGALTDSLYGIGEGFGMVPIRIARHIRKREEHERNKRERQKRREEREQRKIEQQNTATSSRGMDGRPLPAKQDTNLTQTSTLSADPTEPLPMEVIEDLNWGLKRAGAAVLTMPTDFAVAISQGMHNAPRLWGDATIRKPVKIHGVKSGFTAARKEFAYGIYDGWTGLLKQPRDDWEDGETFASKLTGLGTGIGKGLGGFVVKNFNALFAPQAFMVQGLIKHIEKRSDTPGSKPLIRKSRIMQGENELCDLEREQDRDEEGKQDQLSSIRERVTHGYSIYEDMWKAAEMTFGNVGPLAGSLVGRYKMKREKKKWDVNGALESVDTAKHAFQARKEGRDLEPLFAKRREEVDAAERPRQSVMDQPETIQEKMDRLPGTDEEGEVEDAKDSSKVPDTLSVEPVTVKSTPLQIPSNDRQVDVSPIDQSPLFLRNAVTVP